MTRERLEATLTREHLQRMRRSAPVGLLELVKNALDSYATRVTILFTRQELGAPTSVTVEDDGVGMSRHDVHDYFEPLSVSWKREAGRRPVNRDLFGSKGEGRIAAFGIGDSITWETTWDAAVSDAHRIQAPDERPHTATDEPLLRSQKVVWNLPSTAAGHEEFYSEDLDPVRSAHTGTTVTVRDLLPGGTKLDAASVRRQFETHLGEFLEKHSDVIVTFDGAPLDAERVQHGRTAVVLDVPEEVRERPGFENTSPTATLVVVEWKASVDTTAGLWLADAVDLDAGQKIGRPVAQLAARHAAPGITFTAWLLWDGWAQVGSEVMFDELSPAAAPVIQVGRKALLGYLEGRRHDRARELLREWKNDGSYPYDDEPHGPLEAAERQLFDIVAVTAASALEGPDVKARTFALRLLAEAVRTDQTALGRILHQVLDLDDATQEQLSTLLDRAPLGTIVELSHTVLSRSTFLDWLSELMFDETWRAALGEKPGLHDLLDLNTWVFGDEWALLGSEVGLTEAAALHEGLLDSDDKAPTGASADGAGTGVVAADNTTDMEPPPDRGPLLDHEGHRRRLDLILTRARRVTQHRDHFVVELKRPSRTLNKADLDQLENYVDALGNSIQFNDSRIRWTFMLIGTRCTDYVEGRRRQNNSEFGVVSDTTLKSGASCKVWVRTWSEVLSDARSTLAFVQQSLDHAPATEEHLEMLRRLHADVLPDADVTNPR